MSTEAGVCQERGDRHYKDAVVRLCSGSGKGVEARDRPGERTGFMLNVLLTCQIKRAEGDTELRGLLAGRISDSLSYHLASGVSEWGDRASEPLAQLLKVPLYPSPHVSPEGFPRPGDLSMGSGGSTFHRILWAKKRDYLLNLAVLERPAWWPYKLRDLK